MCRLNKCSISLGFRDVASYRIPYSKELRQRRYCRVKGSQGCSVWLKESFESGLDQSHPIQALANGPVPKTHYENTPDVQYTAIFHGCKNDNFRLNFFDYFHIFAQNIYCGYTLEPPH